MAVATTTTLIAGHVAGARSLGRQDASATGKRHYLTATSDATGALDSIDGSPCGHDEG